MVAAQQPTHGGERLVPVAVAVQIVEHTEAVEVEQHHAQGAQRAARLGHHPPERLLRGPPVGQAGEGVGDRALVGLRELPLAGQDRRRAPRRVT